jgi:hypothetical protein
MPTFDGVYLRDSLNDTGVVPSPSPNPYSSPDIIPYGSDTLTIETMTSAAGYANDLGRALLEDEFNNVYVRGKNLASDSRTGIITLYYSKASLLLLPDQWKQVTQPSNQIYLQNTDFKPSLASQQVGAINPPFLLKGPDIPSGDHYCLISTVNNPNVPKSFNNNAEFSMWVRNSPQVAWRNVSIVPASLKVFTAQLTFGNTNPLAQNFYFEVICDGFDVGTTISMKCADATCLINITDTVDTSGEFDASFPKRNVPGSFIGTLTITLKSAKPIPSGASIALNYYQLSTGNDPLEHELCKLSSSRKLKVKEEKSVAAAGVKAFSVGAYTVKFV